METLLASGAAGLVRATPDGDSSLVLPGVDVRALCVDPTDRAVVYAGTNGLGVLRSTDGGLTWSHAGLQWQIVKSLATTPSSAGLVVAGTKPPALFLSRDRGETWHELEGFRSAKRWWWRQPAERPSTPYVQAIAVSPADSDIVLAGIEACALLRSEDGGRSWSGHRKGAFRDCHSVSFHPLAANWAYEAAGSLRRGGAASSTDAGRTWNRDDSGLDHHYGWAVAADPAEPSRWFVTLSQGPRAHRNGAAEAYVYRRFASGRWERLSGGLPQPLTYFPYGLASDVDRPGHLWLGTADGSMWKSVDNGDTWTELPLRFPSIHRSLAVL